MDDHPLRARKAAQSTTSDTSSSSRLLSSSTTSKPKESFYIPSASAPRPTAIYAKSNSHHGVKHGAGRRSWWDDLGGGLALQRGETRLLLGLTILGAVVRFWHIGRPSSVVFDEVHFGGFANKYIQARFFMDVHPPLAKLLITLVAYVSGFKGGSFDFKDIGREYGPEHVPYIAMRILPATFGLFLIPLSYLTLRALQTRATTALLGALFITFENGLITQSRFILLDSPLIFFTALSIFFWVGFSNENDVPRDRLGTQGPFSRRWWVWLTLVGLALGAVVSCKWVGLFTIATIGILTLIQLWGLLGDLRVPMPLLFRHFVARAICLIGVPALFYLSIFWIHFKILRNSGEGDGFMSSEFQHTLDGHGMEDTYADVMVGSHISLRHLNTQGGYLHSHAHTYPTGSKQQQITLYPHRDDNNLWQILNTTWSSAEEKPLIPYTHSPPVPVLDKALLVLSHISTNKKLHSHDVRAPITEVDYQNEVSAYGFDGFEGDANDQFQLEIDSVYSEGALAKKQLQTLRTKFRLRHILTGCYLFSHKVKLPDWGFEQQEVTCNKNPSKENGLWFIETNEHGALPEGSKKVNYLRPGFLKKFWELQTVMWQTNAGLTDRHAYDSRPNAWPFLRRGINFWVKDHRQIYLIGNPFVWWLSSISVLAYIGVRALLILRAQRGFQDFGHSTVVFYDRLCGFLVLGWFMHYFPFFIMSRQLFLHHYFPALYFAILLSACAFDLGTSPLKPKIRLQVTIVVVLVALYSFWHFSPLTYAGVWTRGQCESSKWLKHWDFSCADFHVTEAEYSPKAIEHTQQPINAAPTVTSSVINDIAPGQNAFHGLDEKAPKSSLIPGAGETDGPSRHDDDEENERLDGDGEKPETTMAGDERQKKEVVGAVPAAAEGQMTQLTGEEKKPAPVEVEPAREDQGGRREKVEDLVQKEQDEEIIEAVAHEVVDGDRALPPLKIVGDDGDE